MCIYTDGGTPMKNVRGFYSYYRPLTATTFAVT